MKTKISLGVLAFVSITSLNAMQFQTLGYKSVSMGGAAVASSSSSMATYNNPALLAKSKYDVEIALGGGMSYQDHGAGAAVKSLKDSNFLDAVDRVSSGQYSASSLASDIPTLLQGVDVVMNMDGDAVEASPHGFLAAELYGFGIGVFVVSEGAGKGVVSQEHNLVMIKDQSRDKYVTVSSAGTTLSNVGDPTADQLYQSRSIEYAMNNGLTYLDTKGIAVGEVPLGYAHNFDTSIGNVMVGGALKYMQGYTYTQKYKIDNSGAVSGSGGKRDKMSSSFGVDLGLAYEPSMIEDMTIGFVAKNLNSPEFSVVTGEKITIDPMMRIGVAYNISESFEIAGDFDLSSNKTFVQGVNSQMLGGGLNWHPSSWLSLRGGLMHNMDTNDNAGLIYTAGLGIGIKWFQFDFSGQYSANSTTIEGTTVPEYAKINLAIISRW